MIFISKRTTVKFTAKSKFYRKEADFPLVTFFTIDLHYCLHFGLYFQEKKKKVFEWLQLCRIGSFSSLYATTRKTCCILQKHWSMSAWNSISQNYPGQWNSTCLMLTHTDTSTCKEVLLLTQSDILLISVLVSSTSHVITLPNKASSWCILQVFK